MSRLKKAESDKLNKAVREIKLLRTINKILEDNGLNYEIKHLKLVEKSILETMTSECPPGEELVEVCTENGICKWECWPV